MRAGSFESYDQSDSVDINDVTIQGDMTPWLNIMLRGELEANWAIPRA